MSSKRQIRLLRRILKMFAIGSFAAAPTNAGPVDPVDAIRHEMVWATVRDQLAASETGEPLPEHLRRFIEEQLEKGIKSRVEQAYRAATPSEIASLDAAWMSHFAANGAAASEIDQFLDARTETLARAIKEKPGKLESDEDWIGIIREFNRSPYTSG
jgi:hypothetical protein